MNNPYNAPTADLSSLGDSSQPYQPKVFSMKGRIGRVRYLAYTTGVTMALVLVLVVVAAVLGVMSGGGDGAGAMMAILAVLFYVPLFAALFIMAIRRVHDMGYSGWLSLVSIIPFVNLWLLFASGTQGANEYGPPPVKNSTGVIIAAFSPILLSVVFGIVAAVSIPAYQAYVAKAKAAQGQAAPAAVESAPQ
ncbi:MAG: DUF805 domain-containing protein [Telluria sp.]